MKKRVLSTTIDLQKLYVSPINLFLNLKPFLLTKQDMVLLYASSRSKSLITHSIVAALNIMESPTCLTHKKKMLILGVDK